MAQTQTPRPQMGSTPRPQPQQQQQQQGGVSQPQAGGSWRYSDWASI